MLKLLLSSREIFAIFKKNLIHKHMTLHNKYKMSANYTYLKLLSGVLNIINIYSVVPANDTV